jgi:hypothetical protein
VVVLAVVVKGPHLTHLALLEQLIQAAVEAVEDLIAAFNLVVMVVLALSLSNIQTL